MVAAVKILISLLVILHLSGAQQSSDDSIHASFIMLFNDNPESVIGLLLLVLTVILSGGIYLWILKYVCIGCCQPIAVDSESEALAGMV